MDVTSTGEWCEADDPAAGSVAAIVASYYGQVRDEAYGRWTAIDVEIFRGEPLERHGPCWIVRAHDGRYRLRQDTHGVALPHDGVGSEPLVRRYVTYDDARAEALAWVAAVPS